MSKRILILTLVLLLFINLMILSVLSGCSPDVKMVTDNSISESADIEENAED